MKFVILSQARQGSTLLQNMIDSHPDIHVDGEILKAKNIHEAFGKPLGRIIYRYGLTPYVTWKAWRAPKQHWGFKLILTQVQQPIQFVDNLYRRGFKIIDLRRRNGLHVALSACLATKSGKWFVNNSSEQTLNTYEISPELLLQRLAHYESQLALQDAMIANKEVFKVDYESDLFDAEKRTRFSERFCSYFRVKPVNLSGLTIKSDERHYAERISNYQELMQYLRQSPYVHYEWATKD
ncbi:MAG: sulfotransferase [Chitinophagaceae bacterium]|nr:sulfotransferase [Chitinophagaceae bacterium]